MNDLHDPLPGTAPEPDVGVAALAASPEGHVEPPMARRRSVVVGVALALAIAVVSGGGVWWHAGVAGDPGLEFYGGPNVYRDEASRPQRHRPQDPRARDRSRRGLRPGRSPLRFLRAVQRRRPRPSDRRRPEDRYYYYYYYYWGFDHLSLATDSNEGFVGLASQWKPFRPFTLHRGETREVRLEDPIADCDPAELQAGTSTVSGLDLRYRILGLTRTAHVPLRDAAVALQAVGPCRHPIANF
jgi:hypothetical protein